jgi:conjugal transfer pilus assembly protein TraU
MKHKHIFTSSPIAFIGFLFCMPVTSYAVCNTSPLNPITDISWSCIFPISIGGIATSGADETSQNDTPVCICHEGAVPRVGLKVSFWEPARIIDTVADPYCMMPLGTTINNPKPGTLGGSLSNEATGSGKAFQQMHYFIFPAWKILDMFWDIPCIEDDGFDLAMMSELNPTWNNEVLSLIVNPEAVLFANPASTLACSADAAATMVGFPRNELFWCMGSWGNAYPLAGSITSTDYVGANAGLAARSIFLMGRLGMLLDNTPDGCAKTFTPIWHKNHFKLQMVRPVRDASCQPIGRNDLLWTSGKHPNTQDNFEWMVFKHVDCCISY